VRGLEEIVAVGDHCEEESTPQVRSSRPSAPGLSELGDRLSDRLDTRVKVALGRSKGRISIEFASLADLERIVSVIDSRNRDDRPI
jgi:ParB family chromosome partitioning protein